MTQSILTSVKKMCGITKEQEEYDLDIITLINAAFNTLTQLGLGPEEGFMIEDEDATWDAFIEDDINLNAVKSVMFMKVKLAFDPPVAISAIEALKDQIREQEYRLNVHRENLKFDELYPDEEDDELILDGGLIP